MAPWQAYQTGFAHSCNALDSVTVNFDAMMTLYKIKNGIGYYYVVTEHPTQACEMLDKFLNKADYGSYDDRVPQEIEILATAPDDMTFISGKRLVL